MATNVQLERMVALSQGVDAKGFANLAKAAQTNSTAFRNAAASTGMFEVEQLRLNRATDDYIKKLNAQKLTFRDLIRDRKTAAKAYKEQLALENMMVRKNPAGARNGKDLVDVVVPTEVSREMNTINKQLSFANQQIKSASHQMVNWGKNTQWAGRQMMVGFTMPIAAFGAAAGVMAYQVDKELTRIAKVYDTTATDAIGKEKELSQVRVDSLKTGMNAAKEYGAAITDTLQVQAELAATGKQGADLQTATSEVMRISTLGELERQTAIDATIALQSVFRMSNQELTESFNYMNSVENATSLQLSDFAAAIPVAAAPVKAFGGDIQELGILLTAMKENGIGAAEGANALKATMQRLGRPSKQIREEWTAITGTDITKLVDSSDGLIEVFTKIQQATAGLDPDQQRKAFAGLFGSYQVSKMMALTKGMGELQQGIGQVSEAARVAGMDTEVWADTADGEIKKIQESVSGRFKIALETVKAEMAGVGEPFVKVATVALETISKIMKAFQDLPDGMKNLLAAGIAIAAIAGPIIMLTGVFANMIGSIAGIAAALAGLALKHKFVDRQTRAGALVAEMATSGYLHQRTAVQQLTAELNTYAASMRQANALTLQAHPGNAAVAAAAANAATPSNAAHAAKSGGPGVIPSGVNPFMAAGAANATSSAAAAAAANDEAAARAKTAKFAAGAATSTAAMATAMGIMAFSSNETANSFAQVLLVGSMVVPAVQMMAPHLMKGATAAAGMASGLLATGRNAATAAAGARAMALGFATMLGPIGWATAALTAIVGIAYIINRNEKKAWEERVNAQKELDSSAAKWADTLGTVEAQFHRIALAGAGPEGQQDMFMEYRKEFQKDGSQEKVGDAFNELSGSEQDLEAARLYVEYMAKAGMNAEQAGTAVAALYANSGRSFTEAIDKGNELRNTIGELKDIDWGSALARQTSLFDASVEEFMDTGKDDLMKMRGQQLAEVFGAAFYEANTGDEAQAVIDQLGGTVMDGWQTAFDRISESSLGQKMLEDNQIASAEALATWHRTGEMGSELASTFGGTAASRMWLPMITGASEVETTMVGLISDANGFGDEVSNWDSLIAEANIAAKQLTYDEAVASAKDMVEQLRLKDSWESGSSEESAKTAINAMNAANGYKQGTTAAYALQFLIGKVAEGGAQVVGEVEQIEGELKGAQGAARTLASILSGLSAPDLSGVAQEAMAGVQQQIADDWGKQFDADMQADQDATADYWDNRKEAVSNEMDRRSDALDAKWEKKKDGAEAYWDMRLDRVDKAIEAEQKAEEIRIKIFDAEIARIKRLNDTANTNIDFNVALNSGDLDEAAKISNNAQATDTTFALEQARNAGTKGSERRIKKLEGKKENLEGARDKAMEAMDKREQAEKDHLDRITQQRQDAVDQQAENAIAANDKMWENDKESFDKRMELFLKFTTSNKKELIKHMESVGLSYEDFEADVIDPKSTTWGNYFGKALRDRMRAAGMELKSDAMWADLGTAGVESIMEAMGFANKAQFEKFIKTGEFDASLGLKPTGGKDQSPAGDDMLYGSEKIRHEGGWVDSKGGNSRKGVAKNLKGTHPSEKVALLKNREFVVNEKAAAANADQLEAMNSGRKTDAYGGAGGGGLAGFAAAAMAKAMMLGITKKVQSKVTAAKQQAVANSNAASYSGSIGSYSLPGVVPWGQEAANYLGGKFGISSIGGVGERSNMSDHPAGRAIDLMTSDVAKGDAIAAEAIRLQNVLDATYMIWNERIHSFDSRGWQPYSHPSGATDDTSMHRDHVHISFAPTGKVGDLPKSTVSGNSAMTGYTEGSGGWHRPIPSPYGFGGSTHDISAPIGTPVYAVGDGVITKSTYITSGGSAGNGKFTAPNGLPYRSYGEVLTLSTGGAAVNYAHLQPGSRVGIGPVKGGQQIARSGETGNAWGSHLHMDIGGSETASSWLASRGVSLRKGTMDVRYDNTAANLHKGEGVLTKNLNDKFKQGVDNFANGGNNEYTIIVNPSTGMDEEMLANKVVKKIQEAERRKPQSRTRGNSN